MPYITISTVRGILDAAQKKTLLERVTDLLVEVEGQGNPEFRRNVWVRIEEQEPSHWSLGGMQPTSEIIASTFGTIGADGVRVGRLKT
ncbi:MULTISPECIES: tautomerase family protein [Bradyrhizobium]|uniref:tautomerase family protein n=1 Tax=Bradyrhizobium TaxID=374 RepID=UPI001B8A7EC2|nr:MULTISPECIES: tautomerase family protein [Bradyrhizobium]MBR0974377.1 tautomerase family protein [Bradyrhizobium japonicum]